MKTLANGYINGPGGDPLTLPAAEKNHGMVVKERMTTALAIRHFILTGANLVTLDDSDHAFQILDLIHVIYFGEDIQMEDSDHTWLVKQFTNGDEPAGVKIFRMNAANILQALLGQLEMEYNEDGGKGQ